MIRKGGSETEWGLEPREDTEGFQSQERISVSLDESSAPEKPHQKSKRRLQKSQKIAQLLSNLPAGVKFIGSPLDLNEEQILSMVR